MRPNHSTDIFRYSATVEDQRRFIGLHHNAFHLSCDKCFMSPVFTGSHRDKYFGENHILPQPSRIKLLSETNS